MMKPGKKNKLKEFVEQNGREGMLNHTKIPTKGSVKENVKFSCSKEFDVEVERFLRSLNIWPQQYDKVEKHDISARFINDVFAEQGRANKQNSTHKKRGRR